MSRRRSVSLEPENIAVASPRRSTRLATLRCDSPIANPKTQLTPLRRTRRSMSSQDLYESDLSDKAIPARKSTRLSSRDSHDKRDDSPEHRRRITRSQSKSPTSLKTVSTNTKPVKKRMTLSEKEIEKPLDIISETEEMASKDEEVFENNNKILGKDTTKIENETQRSRSSRRSVSSAKDKESEVDKTTNVDISDKPKRSVSKENNKRNTSTSSEYEIPEYKKIDKQDEPDVIQDNKKEELKSTEENRTNRLQIIKENEMDRSGANNESIQDKDKIIISKNELSNNKSIENQNELKENNLTLISDVKANDLNIKENNKEKELNMTNNESNITDDNKPEKAAIVNKEIIETNEVSEEMLEESSMESSEIKNNLDVSESEQIVLELSEEEEINETINIKSPLKNKCLTNKTLNETTDLFEESKILFEEPLLKTVEKQKDVTNDKELKSVGEKKQIIEEMLDEDEIEIIENTEPSEKQSPIKVIKTKHSIDPAEENKGKPSKSVETINITDDEETQVNLEMSEDVIECTQEEKIIQPRKSNIKFRKIEEETINLSDDVVSSDPEILKERNSPKKRKSLNKQKKELGNSNEKENIIQVDSDSNANSEDIENIKKYIQDNKKESENTLIDESMDFIGDLSTKSIDNKDKLNKTSEDKSENTDETSPVKDDNKIDETAKKPEDNKVTESVVEVIDNLLESVEDKENSIKSNRSEDDKNDVNKEEDETNISIVGSNSPDPNDKLNQQTELKIDIAEVKEQEYNLSLVNDDGLSYSPIGKAADVSPPIVENKIKTPKSESKKKNKTPKKNEEPSPKPKIATSTEKKKKEKARTSDILRKLVDSDSESDVNTSLRKRKRVSRELVDSDTSIELKKKKGAVKPKIDFSDESNNEYQSDESLEDDESDGGISNEFIEDEAMEGDEDTPSEDSNQIIDEGESIGSTSSEFDSDDSENRDLDDFIVDDDEVEDELLSGTEDFLDSGKKTKESPCWLDRKKRRRIIKEDSSEEELDKMSMQPFGGFSPGGSLISVNPVSSVESDDESLIKRNEDLSKMIEDNIEIKDDTKSRINESDIEIIEENNSSDENERKTEMKRKSLNKNESENELDDILSTFCDIPNDEANTLNTSQQSGKQKRKSLNKTGSEDTAEEQEVKNKKRLSLNKSIEGDKSKRKSLDLNSSLEVKEKRKSLDTIKTGSMEFKDKRQSLDLIELKEKRKSLDTIKTDSMELKEKRKSSDTIKTDSVESKEKRKSLDTNKTDLVVSKEQRKSLDKANEIVEEMNKSLEKIKSMDDSIDAELQKIASNVKDIDFDVSDCQDEETMNKEQYNMKKDLSLNFVFVKPRKYKKRDSESMELLKNEENKTEMQFMEDSPIKSVDIELSSSGKKQKKDKRQRKDVEEHNEMNESASETISAGEEESPMKKSKKKDNRQQKEVDENKEMNESVGGKVSTSEEESPTKKSKKKKKKRQQKEVDQNNEMNESVGEKMLTSEEESATKKKQQKVVDEVNESTGGKTSVGEEASATKKSKKKRRRNDSGAEQVDVVEKDENLNTSIISSAQKNENLIVVTETNSSTKKSKRLSNEMKKTKQRLSFSDITEFQTEDFNATLDRVEKNPKRSSIENEWTVVANENTKLSENTSDIKKLSWDNTTEDDKPSGGDNKISEFVENKKKKKNITDDDHDKPLIETNDMKESTEVKKAKKKRKISVSQPEPVVEVKKPKKIDVPNKMKENVKTDNTNELPKKKKTSVSHIEDSTNKPQLLTHKGDKRHKTDILDKKKPIPDSALSNFEIIKVKKIKPSISEFSTVSIPQKPVLKRGHIKPSESGLITVGETKIEDISKMSKTIKKKEKKLKYSNLNMKLISASLSGQSKFSSFKEELLFGKNVKRVDTQYLLNKNLYKLH